jgi:hypothetical protein
MKQQQSVRFQNYTPLTKTSSCEARGMNPLILCRWYSFQVPLGEQKGNSWAPCPWLTSLGTAAELCQWPQHAQQKAERRHQTACVTPQPKFWRKRTTPMQPPCSTHSSWQRHSGFEHFPSSFPPKESDAGKACDRLPIQLPHTKHA